MSTCQHCGREYAESYPLWQCSDTTCGMSPVWNEDGGFEDCINECLYATRERLRAQLTQAREEITALRAELAEWEQLVSESAPLIWSAIGDTESAHEWEKRAADMLTKRAKLLTLDAARAKLKETTGG